MLCYCFCNESAAFAFPDAYELISLGSIRRTCIAKTNDTHKQFYNTCQIVFNKVTIFTLPTVYGILHRTFSSQSYLNKFILSSLEFYMLNKLNHWIYITNYYSNIFRLECSIWLRFFFCLKFASSLTFSPEVCQSFTSVSI